MLRLHQGDALTSRSRAQQQQVFIETRAPTTTLIGLDTMGPQPQRPVSAVGILQQWVLQAILWLMQRRPIGQQARTGHRQQHRRQ